MGFFDRIFGEAEPSGTRDPSDDFWYTEPGRLSSANDIRVTIDRARKVPVVRDCLQTLAQSIAGLSFGVYEYKSQDSRAQLDDHRVMKLFQNPNSRDTSYEFVLNMVDDLASAGYFLAVHLEYDADGWPTKVRRIDPQYVTVEELSDMSLRFRVRRPGFAEQIYLEDEVWFIPTPPVLDGYRGRSAIMDDGREAIAASIALHEYANSFWGNDATPPFVFKYAGAFKDSQSKTNFLRAWARRFSGRNRGKPGVLEHGIDVQQLGATNEASQFLETRKELHLDIARLWRMPPHKVGILDKATFSNIEQQSLEFVVDTVLPWLRLIERSIEKWLIAPDDGAYFQFNVSSLLRGDTKTRFEAYAMGRQWGWINVNEIRALENMNPIGPAGDRYIEPLNMVEAGADREAMRNPDQQQALAVLRATVPRVTSTSEVVERALDDAPERNDAATGAALKVVGGRNA